MILRAFILVFCANVVLVFAAPLAYADKSAFFTTIQDMPLMPGLEELPDQTLVFDKPEGRIIESVASTGSLSIDAIQKFYEDTLPQFGWSRIAENSFVRQGETLHLDFEVHEGQKFLRIMVSPYIPQPK